MECSISFAREEGRGRQYNPGQLLALSDIVTRYKLQSTHVSDIVHSVLAVLTGRPLEDIKRDLQLPSATTIHRAHQKATYVRRDEQKEGVSSSNQYGIEVDEGSKKRKKFFIVQLVYPCEARTLLDVITIPDTTHEVGTCVGLLLLVVSSYIHTYINHVLTSIISYQLSSV